jgi:plasmid stabilization system protein ParE
MRTRRLQTGSVSLDLRHRFFRVGNYAIAYKGQEKPIRIIAVAHGSRDMDAFFRGRATPGPSA